MSKENNNTAYDLSLFEPKQVEREQKKQNIIELPSEKLEKNRKHKINPLRATMTVIAFTAIVGIVTTIVYSQVQLTELTEQLNNTTKKLSESQSVYTQLQMKSDSQLSIETIEKYAKNTLGMKKIEPNQVEYIGLSKGDKGQVITKSQGDNWLTNLWNSIKNLLS